MQIQVNTGGDVTADRALLGEAESTFHDVLSRHADRLTRVEVYLADTNADRGGPDDKRCTAEARPRGQTPVTASHDADTLEQAWTGAARRLATALDTRFGRVRDRNARETIRGADPAAPPG